MFVFVLGDRCPEKCLKVCEFDLGIERLKYSCLFKLWWWMFVFEFVFLGQMAWQFYARDSRECFAKVRHQYILSAASAFTFWNNWAFRMQSGAWQAWRWAPEKAIANEDAPQHNSFHESLPSPPVKRDVLKHLFFESPPWNPRPAAPPFNDPGLSTCLHCRSYPAGECLCPFSSCHSIYMASDPQLWAAIFSPHICRHIGSLVAAWENRLLITCFKSSTLSGKHLTTISALRFKWTPKQRDTLKQLFLPKFSHFFSQKQQFNVRLIHDS